MLVQPTTIPIPVSKSGVCIVRGWGVKLRRERGHLVVSGVFKGIRRETRFARATSRLRRLIVIGDSGYLSLDALTWLADCGITFVRLGLDGRVCETSASYGRDDARLRRAQGRAVGTPSGLAIARDLLRLKVDGEARVARDLPNGAVASASIERLRQELDIARSPAELMLVEAAAASAYWQAWAEVPFPWVRVDVALVPEHWRTVGPRTSPLSGSPRLAITPAHAILGYLLGIAAAEARLACLAAGLDSSLGVLHADQKSRDSMALDVLEAVRPEVEAHLLELLRSSVFKRGQFIEGRRGQCRILPPLTDLLADTAPLWASLLAPVVERVAQAFADSPQSRMGRLPTRLTQANRSAGRDEHRRKPRRLTSTHTPHSTAPICRGCGAEVGVGRGWCDSCRPEVKLQAGLDGLAAGRAKRAELRLRGQDPAVSAAARAKLSKALRRRRAEESGWDRDPPQVSDPTVFRRDVLPLLQGVPVRRLAALTGLSVGYCALVRRGLRTPHPRWWEVLTSAASGGGVYDPVPARSSRFRVSS